MKIGIICLLLISQFINTRCLTLASIGKDLSGTVKDLYSYLRVNLSEIGRKVQNFILTKVTSSNSKTVKETDNPTEDGSKEAFIKFVNNKHTNNPSSVENEQNEPKNLNSKSESVVHLATPQLARWHGRKMESHVIETSDGYLLTLHRIPVEPVAANRTVLLHHGLLGSSTDWVLLGPQKSLPYILSDAGYDVWIANARGNYYSREHISLPSDFVEYWKFSWQEIGQYDLPAIIDYIRLVKNTNESINFIGHSMGATALLVLLSTSPHYNDYLRMGILLAPLAYMNNIKGPLKILASISEDVIKMMGDGEFLPNRKVPSWLANKYCKGPKNFCSNPLLFLSGFQETKRNVSFVARLLYHVPAGGSINTILHYIQLAQSGKFHKYNDVSSEFSVSNVTLPLALFSSSDDWLATVPNVLKLYFCIQNPIDHHVIRERNVSHTDFVWGSEATSLVFNKILDYLENGLTWNMMKQNEVK